MKSPAKGPESKPDQGLIQDILSGNRLAARALYDRYVKQVYRHSHRLAREDELARDITQEVFLKVFRSLTSFRGESSLETWVLRVTHNTAIDVLRRERRIGSREVSLEAGGDIPAATAGTSHELRLRLLTAIEKLDEERRSVLILHDIDGYSHLEIAEILDIPEGTSKSRLSRARMSLRGHLGDDPEGIERK